MPWGRWNVLYSSSYAIMKSARVLCPFRGLLFTSCCPYNRVMADTLVGDGGRWLLTQSLEIRSTLTADLYAIIASAQGVLQCQQ